MNIFIEKKLIRAMKESILYPITFLKTKDLEETKNFYNGLLDLPVALDQGVCIIFKLGEQGFWGFCRTEEEIAKPEQICMTIVVDTYEQVDQWHEHMKKQNVQIKKAPDHTKEYGIYNAFYVDNNGYTLEIQAFDEDAEPTGHKKIRLNQVS